MAAYERSAEVTRFTSRFDTGTFTGQELRGERLFMQNCTTCHAMGRRGGDHPLRVMMASDSGEVVT
jgi:cytochrome c peroxidase